MKNIKPNNSAKRPISRDSFLESLRDIASSTTSTVKDDLLKKGSQDVIENLFPFFKPQDLKGEQGEKQTAAPNLEQEYQKLSRRFETVRREEKVLFTRAQKETQNQVTCLQEEIGKLAKATSELASQAREAEMSAMQNVVETGTYHINFFTRLRKIVAELRSKIQESSFWLAAWNKKSQKRNYYWGQFKKSGSKFSLSADRYAATQAG